MGQLTTRRNRVAYGISLPENLLRATLSEKLLVDVEKVPIKKKSDHWKLHREPNRKQFVCWRPEH
jgi:hypothetical protein